MNITYYLSSSERESLRTAILNFVDIGDLRYYYGWGEISIICEIDGEAKLIFESPVFDFALSLLYVVNALHDKDTIDLDFTEGNGKLIFRREKEVVITSDFSDWACECDFLWLETRAKLLYVDLIRDLDLPKSFQNNIGGIKFDIN
jgi:hypothetical protein